MIRLWTAQMEPVWRDRDRQISQDVSRVPKETPKASDQEKPKSQPEQPKLPRSTKPEAKPEVEPVPRDRGQRIPQDVSRIPNEAPKASDQEKPKSQPEQPKLPRSTKPEAKPEVEPVPRDRDRRVPFDLPRVPMAPEASGQEKSKSRLDQAKPPQSAEPEAKPEEVRPEKPEKSESVNPFPGLKRPAEPVYQNPFQFGADLEGLKTKGGSFDDLAKMFDKRQKERRQGDRPAGSPTSRAKHVEKDW